LLCGRGLLVTHVGRRRDARRQVGVLSANVDD
jgi:hypothetical protein